MTKSKHNEDTVMLDPDGVLPVRHKAEFALTKALSIIGIWGSAAFISQYYIGVWLFISVVLATGAVTQSR